MAEEMTNVVFIKVDVDECEDVATEYNISCMPTFLFLKNGTKVNRFFKINFSVSVIGNLISNLGC